MSNGTPLRVVYEAFLARIESNEWNLEDLQELEIAKTDWKMFLHMAIFRFRFPRISLEIADVEYSEEGVPLEEHFVETITQREIQVLSTYMKHEWLQRCIASWDEVKMLYSTKDFSQANHLDKLIKASELVNLECKENARTYDRSINGSPFDFTRFAGSDS